MKTILKEFTENSILNAISLHSHLSGLSLPGLVTGWEFRDTYQRDEVVTVIKSVIETLLKKGFVQRLYDPIGQCFIGYYRTTVTLAGKQHLEFLKARAVETIRGLN